MMIQKMHDLNSKDDSAIKEQLFNKALNVVVNSSTSCNIMERKTCLILRLSKAIGNNVDTVLKPYTASDRIVV